MSDLDHLGVPRVKPEITVDMVVFTVIDNELKALLVKRSRAPFEGQWALPGGFILPDEGLDDAAKRMLKKKTGMDSEKIYLEQLYTFGSPKRDPRGRVVTVAYFALVDSTTIVPHLSESKGVEDIQWYSISALPKLGFDHEEIVRYAIRRLRYKLEYTAVGFELLPENFTLTQLQSLYETILNEKLDKRNFRKKIIAMKIVEPTNRFKTGVHRPAQFYRFKNVKPHSTFKQIKFEK